MYVGIHIRLIKTINYYYKDVCQRPTSKAEYKTFVHPQKSVDLVGAQSKGHQM